MYINYKKNDYKNVIKSILYYNTMKLIKTNKKYQQVTLNIEYEYKEDNTQINVEDTDILNTKMCVNDINKNIDFKLSIYANKLKNFGNFIFINLLIFYFYY